MLYRVHESADHLHGKSYNISFSGTFVFSDLETTIVESFYTFNYKIASVMALLQAQHLVILGITAVVFHLLTTAQRSGLRQIPGPFLAKVTDLWRLFDHWRGTHVETQRSLHEKYGPAVRIGPNAVSLSDPALLKTVYSTRGEFAKVSSKNHGKEMVMEFVIYRKPTLTIARARSE